VNRVRIAVAGAGLIGRRHIALVRANPACDLVAIVDPAPAARELADEAGVPVYAELGDMLEAVRLDGVIVASPNTFHVQHGLRCVDAGVPVLVEKPIADTVSEAEVLVVAAEKAGVPLLVGHHRRHSPILCTARDILGQGVLGRLVAVMGSAMFYKPDDYFDHAPWRREAGGGPILINLIHEIDNLRALCGDIVSVQAAASNEVRGFPVEDTAAVTMRFASGALGTFLLSDTAASARSWEQTSREDGGYPSYGDEDCYVLAGTEGSLSIPSMRLKVFAGTRSWWEPFETSVVDVERDDPLARQLEHFRAVVLGQARPLVDGREGLRTLRVTQAVADAAATGELVSTR
jgi:predicted dehydrogenase